MPSERTISISLLTNVRCAMAYCIGSSSAGISRPLRWIRYNGVWPGGGVSEILASGDTCNIAASARFAEMKRQPGSWATAIGTGARARIAWIAWRRGLYFFRAEIFDRVEEIPVGHLGFPRAYARIRATERLRGNRLSGKLKFPSDSRALRSPATARALARQALSGRVPQ